jgi:hypothetical protein
VFRDHFEHPPTKGGAGYSRNSALLGPPHRGGGTFQMKSQLPHREAILRTSANNSLA